MTELDRPDWIVCALTGMFTGKPPKPEQRTWCGREEIGFCFTDASHAALNGRQGGRLVLCPECRAAIEKALSAGAEEATSPTPVGGALEKRCRELAARSVTSDTLAAFVFEAKGALTEAADHIAGVRGR